VIHSLRAAAADGGLISYGFDLPNVFRQAAVYADRILKGADPADLSEHQHTRAGELFDFGEGHALGITSASTTPAALDYLDKPIGGSILDAN